MKIPLSIVALLLSVAVSAQNNQSANLQLDTTHIAHGLTIPWSLEMPDDDHIIFTELTGRIGMVDIHSGKITDLYQVPKLAVELQAGLMGLALDPGYEENRQLYIAYIYYQSSRLFMKVDRLKMHKKNKKLKKDKTIIDNIPVASINVGGGLHIDDNKMLYLSVGEGEASENAQETDKLYGKILRYHLDGSIPKDNPIAGSPIYAIGLRNSQGICSGAGNVYASEHGTLGDDEINRIEKNANYGWPYIGGKCLETDEKCNDDQFTEPLEDWSPSIAPAGIAWYDHAQISPWRNSVLMACLKTQTLKVVTLDKDGRKKINEADYFTRDLGRIRDVVVSRLGRVFVCTSNTDSYSADRSILDKIIEIRPGVGFVKTNMVKNKSIDYLKLDSTVLEIKTIAENVRLPWDLHWGYDNWLWFAQRNGYIKKIKPETGEIQLIHFIDDVYESVDNSGMHGFSMHPDFPNQPYLYVHYCYELYKSKLIRLTYDVNSNRVTNTTILIDDFAAHKSHNGSRIVFSPDGYLFLSMGDGYKKRLPQDLSSNNGKVLRIHPDGRIPDDNPIPGSAVWSWGHRNPQGLVFSPTTGLLYSSEHGAVNDDEVNLIEKGRNYGWPTVQGFCNLVSEQAYCEKYNIREPMYSWTPTIGVSGMDIYTQDVIPEWKNSLLVTSLKGGMGEIGQRLYVMKLDESGKKIVSYQQYFEKTFGRLRDVMVHPDGDRVYLITSNDEPNDNGWEVLQDFDDRIIEISVSTKKNESIKLGK